MDMCQYFGWEGVPVRLFGMTMKVNLRRLVWRYGEYYTAPSF
jgi:hypothetical protein